MTLDPDSEALLRDEMRKRRLTFKTALNEAIRRGLQRMGRPNKKVYRVRTFSSGFQPGVDPTKLNQLADQLETEEYIRRALEREARDHS